SYTCSSFMKRRRSSVPEDFKRFILSERKQEHILHERKRRLYNRFFHKSLFYRSSLAVRLGYVVMFVIVFCLYNTTHSTRLERYVQCESRSFRGQKSTTDIVHIQTNYDEYRVSNDFRNCSRFKPGDILIVERNLFGKPIHFTQDEWDMTYGIYKNYVYYYMLLFATALTFFFHDGLDFFTTKLLYLFYAVDLISMVAFFIT
ncbi:MAG: hypothetical protein V4580_17845, partial [Bacteroidota bacterium]